MMIRILPLIAMLLAACDQPLQELYPAERHTIETEQRTYLVRAEYDPFERGWFALVSVPDGGRLEPDDRFAVFDVVQNKLGPKVCDGAALEVKPEKIWTGHGAKSIRYMPVNGEWQLLGRCV
ncbi:MAG: hypothetical protein AAF557_04810 [Pseudomonadota bacterium]